MKQDRLNPISAKRKKQLLLENELKRLLYKKQGGLCAKCKRKLDWHWAGWDKHEIKSRSQGGDPLDPNNCELVCRLCHIEAGGERVINSKPQWSKGG